MRKYTIQFGELDDQTLRKMNGLSDFRQIKVGSYVFWFGVAKVALPGRKYVDETQEYVLRKAGENVG